MDKFGSRLKSLRKNKRVSQKELGAYLGLGQTTIANYEKGTRYPNGETLMQIADYFDVTLDELLGRKIKNKLKGTIDYKRVYEGLKEALFGEDDLKAMNIVRALVNEEMEISYFFEKIIKPIMVEVGQAWECGDISVAQEHHISQIVNKVLAVISVNNPPPINNKGPALCLSLSSEPHTLGIQMISEYLKCLGYYSYYLGTNLSTDQVMTMLIEKKASLLALSITMDYHLDNLKNMLHVIRSNSRLKGLKIIVGGHGLAHAKGSLAQADGVANDFETLKKLVNQWEE